MTKKYGPSVLEVDALLFDLDGTLIDSKQDIATAVNLTLHELGLPTRSRDEIFSFVGDGVKRLLRLSVGEENLEQYEQALHVFRGHYLTHCLDTTRLYPGMWEALQHFKAKRKAIVTNKSREYTMRILEGLGIVNWFTAIESPEDRADLKPEPSMIWRVLSTCRVSGERAVMIGDSTTDIRAAQAAKIKSCAVLYGYGNLEKIHALCPDCYCARPIDLTTLFV
ncbi:MAG: HAD family hydrolase [Nitrospirae bacterium]|nr:MAG: HAD family hydrolase [Nitrospirota bacterium]